MTVAPFFPGANSFTNSIPNPSVNFLDQGPPPDGLRGLIAAKPPAARNGAWTPGMAFDAQLTNGPLTIKYVQNVRNTQDGANGSATGAVFTAASKLANQTLLPIAGSGLTFPALDSFDPADPTAQEGALHLHCDGDRGDDPHARLARN